MNRTIIELLLDRERDDTRFEHLVNDVVSLIEQTTVVDTHAKSDLGSDGKTYAGRNVRVASSIRYDWRVKFRSDADTIANTLPQNAKVYFVTNRNVTQKEFEKLRDDISERLGNRANIEMLGGVELADISADNPDVFRRHYAAAYDDFITDLNKPQQDDSSGTETLRLALATIGAPDSRTIRSQLYHRGMLFVLGRGTLTSISSAAKQFSELYHLPSQLPLHLIRTVAAELVGSGFVSAPTEDTYQLTDQGRQRLNDLLISSIKEERIGRSAIRDRLQESIGHAIADEQFEKIWIALEREITTYFTQKGQAFVSFILALTDPARTHELQDEEAFIKSIGAAVAATTTYGPLADELATATEDIFWERQSPAHEWLADLCVAYVMVCTLGFERDVRDQVVSALKRCAFVLDTDVVLTLLCEGETDFTALNDFFYRWKRLGGRTFTARVVTSEAAYHAVIARRDYADIEHLLPGSDDDRQRLVDNAFVRAFAYRMSEGAARKAQWEAYINQYAPRTDKRSWPKEKDAIRAIEATLANEFDVQLLTPVTNEYRELADKVFTYLEQRPPREANDHEVKNYLDKSKRDAELYAALVQGADDLRNTTKDSALILVSSARRLARVEQKFSEIGQRQLVVPPSAIIYLLSVIPEVTIGRTALRNFLFDPVRRRFSSKLEKIVLRAIREADASDLPFARRTPLIRQLRESVLEHGSKMPSEADKKLLSEPELLAPRLASALSAVNADSPLAKKVRELEVQNARLATKLQNALERNRERSRSVRKQKQ